MAKEYRLQVVPEWDGMDGAKVFRFTEWDDEEAILNSVFGGLGLKKEEVSFYAHVPIRSAANADEMEEGDVLAPSAVQKCVVNISSIAKAIRNYLTSDREVYRMPIETEFFDYLASGTVLVERQHV